MKAGRELDALIAEKPYKCRVCGSKEYRFWGGRRRCVVCHKASQKRTYAKNKERWAEERRGTHEWTEAMWGWRIKKRYGIVPEEYDILLEKQGGACIICGDIPTNRRLDIDHDHNTGEIRGLLCNKCNRGLSIFRESSELMRLAACYLE